MKEYLGQTVAFIPVRGGSKSIPLKNIKKINGRPLIYWTLDASIACEEIDKVIVSTDSEEIRTAVERYNSPKIKIIDRSKMVSDDTASTESTMLEFAEAYDFENVILIQATSPLLTAKDLNQGLRNFHQDGIDSILSVVRQKRFIWKNIEDKNTFLPENYNPQERPRRQDFKGYLVENGAFYITSRADLLKTKCRISGNISVVEMPEETYFEIDEPSDWMIVEKLLEKSNKDHQFVEEKNQKSILQGIKCLLTDSDGVLTDSGMYYSESGDELKKFNTKDGMGFKLLKEVGIITGIITGENVDLVKRRAEKIKADEIHLGIGNKLEIVNSICQKYNIELKEIAYIGDDINDLEVIKAVGLGCAANDGILLVKKAADYITEAKGGQGAFREVADLILEGKKDAKTRI